MAGPTHDTVGDRTVDLLGLMDVHRWSVIKTMRTQSVAEHSFAVAVIAMDLAHRLWDHFPISEDDYAAHLLWWSLVHDAPETLTGDIDGKFKRMHPEVRAAVCEAENKEFPWFAHVASMVSPAIKAIVKLADRIEALRFIQDCGYGVRADDVFRENIKWLESEGVEWAAKILGMEVDDVMAAIRFTLHYSTSESNSIQLRRHRVPTSLMNLKDIEAV